MIREAITTAETTEEAIRLGCEELGIDRDDACTEIIEYPTPKKFGLFGGSPAKVRVYIEVEDPEPVVADEPKYVPAPVAEIKEAKPVEAEKPVEKPAAPKAEAEEAPAADESNLSEQAKIAVNYLRAVLAGMGLKKIKVIPTENADGAQLELVGDGLGTAIGRRGENLTALQYLVSLAANNNREDYYRVAINIGNYREKREQALEALAQKISARALKINKNLALEPMNPYERRIVHTIVHDIEGVTSWSVGEDAKRHVVIGPEGLDEGGEGLTYQNRGRQGGRSSYGNRGGYRGGNRERGSYGNRGGYRGGNRDRGSSYGNRGGYRNNYQRTDNSAAPAEPKRDYSAGSLYGKIEVPKKTEE